MELRRSLPSPLTPLLPLVARHVSLKNLPSFDCQSSRFRAVVTAFGRVLADAIVMGPAPTCWRKKKHASKNSAATHQSLRLRALLIASRPDSVTVHLSNYYLNTKPGKIHAVEC